MTSKAPTGALPAPAQSATRTCVVVVPSRFWSAFDATNVILTGCEGSLFPLGLFCGKMSGGRVSTKFRMNQTVRVREQLRSSTD